MTRGLSTGAIPGKVPLMRLLLVLFLALSSGLSLAPAKELPLTLVSFNIRMITEDDGNNQWHLRRDLLFDTVRKMDPDVLGIQEAYAVQLKELLSAFDDYASVGVGRDDGKEAGEYSAVLYKKARFTKKGGGTFWLSDTPHVVASNTWDAACNRVCSWVTLTDQQTERSFSVYNAHFDHKSTKAREMSPIAIVKEMVAKGHEKAPLILMGDFNSGPNSPQMRYLLEGTATLSGAEEKCPILFRNTLPAEDARTSATYSGWDGRTEGRQIDYVLVAGKQAKIVSGEIVRHSLNGRYPSDHYPVRAEVIFP